MEGWWCGDEPLCFTFSSLFALAMSNEAWVADVWNSSIEWGGLTSCFSRPFNDWKVESVEQFLLRLQEKRVYRDEEDNVLWIESKSRNFLVKTLYLALESGGLISFLMSIIWNSWVPPKVGFFAWKVTWGKT